MTTINKGESKNIRLTADQHAKIKELATVQSKSESQIIRDLLDTALDNEGNYKTLLLKIEAEKQLSCLMGQIQTLLQHWRDVRSRINSPRPINPNDTQALAEWEHQKQLIQRYVESCEEAIKWIEQCKDRFSHPPVVERDKMNGIVQQLNVWTNTLKSKKELLTVKEQINLDMFRIFLEILAQWKE